MTARPVGRRPAAPLTRRGALGLAGGLAAGLALARRAAAGERELPAVPLARARRPEPGLVEYEIEAVAREVRLAGGRARLWTYGGRFPGPMLRAREGETVRLHFVNRLPEATNLHFHGLHVPPSGRADNTWLHLPPGERFTYEFTIPKGEAGTYWYHPHAHGTLARQLWAGLAGPLIVDGPLDRTPELAAADERVILLRDLALDDGRPSRHRPHDWHKGKEGDLVLVNGALQPTLRARSSLMRLRLINASNARYFRLALDDGQPLHLIAADGHMLERPVALSEVLLVPGERADLLILFEDNRPLALMDLPYDRRVPSRSRREALLTLEPPPRPQPAQLPERLADLPVLRTEDAAVRRRITMAMFLMSGRPFNPDRVDVSARVGDLELWEVENVGTMDHPFHTHTWYFQVIARNGRPEPFRAWRDMVNLRPGDRVELLLPLKSYRGKSFYHCHIAEHGDQGMMAVLEVR